MGVDAQTFRTVLGQWPTGVAVVTTTADGWHGMTASSFSSVSLDPPMVLVCLARGIHTHALVERSGAFAVSILGEDQAAIGHGFAGHAPGDRFAGQDWTAAPTGAPVLDAALAWLDCRVAHAYPGGDHTIFVGEVTAARVPRRTAPLLFHSRAWGQLADPLPESAVIADTGLAAALHRFAADEAGPVRASAGKVLTRMAAGTWMANFASEESRGSFVGNQLAISACYLGTAQSVYDFALDRLTRATFADSGRPIASSPMHQVIIGEMTERLETAYLWIRRQLQLETSDPPLLPKRDVYRQWRIAKGDIAESCYQVALGAFKACGTSAATLDGVIGRGMRDLAMGLVMTFPAERGRLEAAQVVTEARENDLFASVQKWPTARRRTGARERPGRSATSSTASGPAAPANWTSSWRTRRPGWRSAPPPPRARTGPSGPWPRPRRRPGTGPPAATAPACSTRSRTRWNRCSATSSGWRPPRRASRSARPSRSA
ncbi:flavin reductase [Actinomadura sp. KC345]|uniref:flavin reductase n=1 Tax=Actinomadura sp. KC345 TaxID=2530371 RepID=UPI0014049D8C|nr:flavin reductase [Actinomadura sp. KC345]